MDANFNCYQVLELPPSEKDVAKIEAAAKTKMGKLNNDRNPTRQQENQILVKQLSDFIKIIKEDPQVLAVHAKEYAQIAEKEKEEQKQAILTQAKFFVNKEIDQVSLDSLIERFKLFSENEILSILKATKKKAKIFKYKDDETPELERSIFNDINLNLRTLKNKDLYDFLGLDPKSDTKTIAERYRELYDANQKEAVKTPQVTARGTLCGLVKSVLCNADKRKSYNKSTENLVFTDIYNQIELATKSEKVILPEQYESLLDDCAKKRIGRDKAEFYIYEYCKGKITIIEPSDSGSVKWVTCRFCEASNKSQDSKCRLCSMPLILTCPKCNRRSADPREMMCTQCGFSFGDMSNAINELKQAENALNVDDLHTAGIHLLKAKTYWSTYDKIPDCQKRLNEKQAELDLSIKKMDELKKGKLYCALKEYINLNKRKINNTIAADNIIEADNAINRAKAEIAKAQKANNQAARIDLYMQSLNICADLKEAETELVNNPPQKPANFTAVVTGKKVQLNWEKLPSNNIHYCIVRKKDGKPSNHKDGEIIAPDLTNNNFEDLRIDTGKSYHYAVFSKCGAIHSREGAVNDLPVLMMQEIENLTSDPIETEVNFSFTLPANDNKKATADVYRDGKLIKTVSVGVLTDKGLVTGRTYNYKFIVVFEDCLSKKHYSKGIELQVKPAVPPKPITTLKFKKEGENVILSWDAKKESANSLRILYADATQGRTSGTLISIKDLENLGTLLSTTIPDKAIVKLNSRYVKNFFSIWTLHGSNAMYGSEVEIVNIPEVSDLKAYIRSGKIYIEWRWPDNCSQIKISYSNKSFDDTYKTVKNYPKALYDKQKAFVIETVTDKDYFIEVQTQKFDRNQEILSSGARTALRNSNPMTINYFLKVSTFLGKKLTLTVTNNSNKPLPELILVGAPNRMPTRREDGITLHVIPEGSSCGTFKLPDEHIKKNYYARLFLSDSSIRNITIITPDNKLLKIF